jgi:hypothetical protein
MAAQLCKCTHEKRDHRITSGAGRGACNQCLCDAYAPNAPRKPKPVIQPETYPTPIRRDWMLR